MTHGWTFPRTRSLPVLILACLLGGWCTGAAAAQRALLVGVSELVNQPQSLWLQAPRNDVQLVRQTLLGQRWRASDIVVLADGVSGAELPEARRIHEALKKLLDQSVNGDFVLLYFSGHGTRWRDPDKRYEEPDGLAETFLARDVQGRLTSESRIPGGLRDVEFEGWINAFLAKNVFVWAVFDTCSATSMTRGTVARAERSSSVEADDDVRFRGVRVEQLAAARQDQASAKASFAPSVRDLPKARYVGFFAAESHQLTPELKLPRKARDAKAQGLLTWAIVEALNRKPATWRDLFHGVLNLYPPIVDELQARFPAREMPSPVAEGALDAPLFSNTTAVAGAVPVWSALRTGANLTMTTGKLDGLDTDQAVTVTAYAADGRAQSASAKPTHVDLSAARVSVPGPLAALPNVVEWRVSPQSGNAAAALRVDQGAVSLPGMSLEYPASVEWVTDGSADIRIVRGDGGFRLEHASGLVQTVRSVEDVSAQLERWATIKWLEQLSGTAAGSRLEGFSATLSGLGLDKAPLSTPGLSRSLARTGDKVALDVVNATGTSVDLIVVAVDPKGGVHAIYPATSGETNRFESGSRQTPASKRFALPPGIGGAGSKLIVVATPAKPRSAGRLFGWVPEIRNADIRVRGQLTAEQERQVFAAVAEW